MNQPDEAAGNTGAAATTPAAAQRVAFERLRERGDELELLISGLLAFSLLTLPSRLFEAWVGVDAHGEGLFGMTQSLVAIVGIGLGYSLGFAFVAHLAIRGYWVGLIGLKAHFPQGVRWDRLPLPGPVSRAAYRHMAGDLGETIDRIDRTASVLFAAAILSAIGLGWVGLLGLILLLPAALFGLFFEDAEQAALIFFVGVGALALIMTAALPVLDRQLDRRQRADAPSPRLQRAVRALMHAQSFFVALPFSAPLQLILQSNLPSRGIRSIFYIVPMLALLAGGVQMANARLFSMLNPYQVITTEAVEHGMLSAHYESLRGPDDMLQRVPMIPADRIEARQLRLFIPHLPRRDVPLAREACTALPHGRNDAEGPAAATTATACIARLWTLRLDGKPLSLAGFVPMERRDLGLRGVVGYLELKDLPTGRHDLQLVWNPAGDEKGSDRKREYNIPFWYDPQPS